MTPYPGMMEHGRGRVKQKLTKDVEEGKGRRMTKNMFMVSVRSCLYVT